MNPREIELLIKAIGAKHSTYCTFTIKSGYTDDKADYANIVKYATYIADTQDPHQDHSTLPEAIAHFEAYLKIEDLDGYNLARTKTKLDELIEEREDLDYDIQRLQGILGEGAN
jgi:hypothetical protein